MLREYTSSLVVYVYLSDRVSIKNLSPVQLLPLLELTTLFLGSVAESVGESDGGSDGFE